MFVFAPMEYSYLNYQYIRCEFEYITYFFCTCCIHIYFDIFKVFVNRYVYVKNRSIRGKCIHNEKKKRVEFEIKWCSEDDATINLFLVLSFARAVFFSAFAIHVFSWAVRMCAPRRSNKCRIFAIFFSFVRSIVRCRSGK